MKCLLCKNCGKSITTGSKLGFCKSCSHIGLKHSKETIKRIKKGQEGRNFDYLKGDKNPAKRPEVRVKISKGLEKRKGWKFDKVNKVHGNVGKLKGDKNPAKRPEVRVKLSKSTQGENNGFYNKHHTEKVKKKIGVTIKQKYKNDLTFQNNIRKARNMSPNNTEIKLNGLLNKLFPSEYKFVGDFYTFIGGKNPDFINVKGKKKLIELFGDYWHRNDNPQDRIDHFKQYGFDTLIIWERELKDNRKLEIKLKRFHKGGG